MNGKTPSPAIHLHIEHLVLDGMAHIDPATLTAALQEALSRELSTTQLLRTAVLPVARATVTLPAACGTPHLAGTVAQAIAGVVANGDTSASPGYAAGRRDHHG